MHPASNASRSRSPCRPPCGRSAGRPPSGRRPPVRRPPPAGSRSSARAGSACYEAGGRNGSRAAGAPSAGGGGGPPPAPPARLRQVAVEAVLAALGAVDVAVDGLVADRGAARRLPLQPPRDLL